MKINVPRDLKGFAFDQVIPFDFTNFDVDLLLPNLFFRVVSRGQRYGTNANDPTAILAYARELANRPDVLGLDTGEAAIRLADRLVRTALIQVGRRGSQRNTEQILGIMGYSLLAFKPGFPVVRTQLRRVDVLLYRMLCDRMRSEEHVLSFFRKVFGRGVELHTGAAPDGRYDGATELDALTRLELAYLDGFEPISVRSHAERPKREAMPAVANDMAQDLRRYMVSFHDLMPFDAFTYHLKALINFELFVYTVKLMYAIIDLVDYPDELPPAMSHREEVSPPEIYADFVGARVGLSREMAAACVRRDLEATSQFIKANLTLRHLARIVARLRGDRRVAQAVAEVMVDEGGPEHLQALLKLREDPVVSLRIDAAAQHDEDAVWNANTGADGDGEDQGNGTTDELDFIASLADSDLERLVLILFEAQRTTITNNVIGWYWSVGGLQKPHGILNGNQKSRQSWRYAPSNDLLATLVQLAAVDIPKWDEDDPCPKPIKLRDFLAWLEARFGIVIDRPPEGFEGAEYVAAAQENLRAMLRRLQQMGVFRDLSDDFTVQRLTPPYVAEAEEAVPA